MASETLFSAGIHHLVPEGRVFVAVAYGRWCRDALGHECNTIAIVQPEWEAADPWCAEAHQPHVSLAPNESVRLFL